MTRHPNAIDLSDVQPAADGVARVSIRTPVVRSHVLSRAGRSVWLKLENLQVTGSFKVTGAAARIAALDHAERSRGIVTCSSGNHGRAVSYVAEQFGISATVCVPVWVDPSKGSRQYQLFAVIGAVSNRLPVMAPALLTNFWGRSLW